MSDPVQRFCRTLVKRLNGFGGDDKGISAIEFAMLAPVFFALMVEVLQLGLYFYTSASVNYATNYSARAVLTGQVQNNGNTQAQFVSNYVCPAMFSSFNNATSCGSSVIVNLVDLTAQPGPGGFYSMVNAAQNGLIRPQPVDPTGPAAQFCPGYSGGVNPNGSTGQVGNVEVLQIYYPMPVVSFLWAGLISTSVVGGANVFYVGSSAAFQNEPYQYTAQSGC